MKKALIVALMLSFFLLFLAFTSKDHNKIIYSNFYKEKIDNFRSRQQKLLSAIDNTKDLQGIEAVSIINEINENRSALKSVDFWLRYLEPLAYKKINGPLPVEWETEVFEKYEPPYKREGAGLTLASLYLEEDDKSKDSLSRLVSQSITATNVFLEDSVTKQLNTYHHFFLANRLYILNLASIYSTGFECPDTSRIIPELLQTLQGVRNIYTAFNQAFPSTKLTAEYENLFEKTIEFVKNQSTNYSSFDHFTFIQQYVNPLYEFNHNMILDYAVRSNNYNDYALNRNASSIFNKALYRGQNAKGVYIAIDDEQQLGELKNIGKMLFFDPILSFNNKRSCASCHNPNTFFTDTIATTNIDFDNLTALPRNTASLLNTVQNHLLMVDGKHIDFESQITGVITNPIEMRSTETEVLQKILSCNQYKDVFRKYLKTTPQYKTVNLNHIASAITLYFSEFSNYYSNFDKAMNNKQAVNEDIKSGFNLFMSKAQCATCHFVPQFNGTKPPFIGSEFEVIGVPADIEYKQLSSDKGRYNINPATETNTAFRTSTIRNASVTKPYMHNGVFKTLEEVLDFYDGGGGVGHGLKVSNQTLSSDSLKLSKQEKQHIIAFIKSLTEDIPTQQQPNELPTSSIKTLNNRKTGGHY